MTEKTIKEFIYQEGQDKYKLLTPGSDTISEILGYKDTIANMDSNIASINSSLETVSDKIDEIRVQFIDENSEVPKDQANVLFLKRTLS